MEAKTSRISYVQVSWLFQVDGINLLYLHSSLEIRGDNRPSYNTRMVFMKQHIGVPVLQNNLVMVP